MNLRESLNVNNSQNQNNGRGGANGKEGGRMGQRKGTLAIEDYADRIRKQSRVTSARYAENEAVNKKSKQKTAKAVLGEMYPDKSFLMDLLDDEELTKGTVNNGMSIHELILSGLNYLDTRTDFWQQHKPIYARKRDRALMQQKWSKAEAQQGSQGAKSAELQCVQKFWSGSEIWSF